MWDWLLKREAGQDRLGPMIARPLSRYMRDVLDAESSSVAAGLCGGGHFNQKGGLTDERVLRRAVDYYMVVHGPGHVRDDALGLNLALLTYLQRVLGSAFALTAGWYELAGRAHGRDTAESLTSVIDERICNPGSPLPVHVWLTSRAFEILDVTIGRLLGGGATGHDEAVVPFYFRAPSAADLLVYHPTGIIDVHGLDRYLEHKQAKREPARDPAEPLDD